jgi:hypothetical protein
MFDKEQYWRNRADGQRGQGQRVKPKGSIFLRRNIKGYPIPAQEGGMPHATVGNKPVSKKAMRKNSKRARRANNVTQ